MKVFLVKRYVLRDDRYYFDYEQYWKLFDVEAIALNVEDAMAYADTINWYDPKSDPSRNLDQRVKKLASYHDDTLLSYEMRIEEYDVISERL